MIVGIGIDMIEVDRVFDKVERHEGFKEKVFSANEIKFCEANRKSENFAARFAAKEAFLKATGLGLILGHELSHIEVMNDDNGKPYINLLGDFKNHAEKNGWRTIHVSLSHLREIACAVVIIEK
ncbi:MAG TPA: holo-ACP synthase [Chryseolinea sp.]